MTDPTASDPAIESFGDLPIQPTGSGVADLEIAYEQMKLADDDASVSDVITADDATESAAHPS